MFQTYQPSGRFGAMAFPLMIVGLVATIVLAFVYQLALYWIPLIYVNFLATLGMGYALGYIGAFAVDSGKVRNGMLAVIFAVMLASVGLGAKFYFQYLQYRVEVSDYLESEGLPEAARQQVLAEETFWTHIEYRVETGWEIGRGGGGAPISGIFVYLVWLIEAGVVFFTATTMTVAAASRPYNEKVDQWAIEQELVMTLPITDQSMIAQIDAATSVDDLLAIPIPKTDESNQFALYKVNSIEGQELEDAYLTVTLLIFSINNKGEQQQNEKDLVKHAILTSAQRQQLNENASLLQEAMEEFRASIDAEEAEEAGDGNTPAADFNEPEGSENSQ